MTPDATVPPPDRREKFFLAVAVALAFLTRLAWALGTAGKGHFVKYFFLGRKLAEADWIPGIAFTSSPLYTYIVGILHVACGLGEQPVRFIQAAVGAATVLAAWYASRRFLGRTAGLATAAIMAFHAALILYDTEPQTSAWELFFNALSLSFLARSGRDDSRLSLIGAGLALGLSALLRPNILLWIPFILAWLWMQGRRPGEGKLFLGRAALLLLSAVATIAPVTWMNFRADGDFVPITASGGSTFYGGNSPDAVGNVFQPPEGNIALQLRTRESDIHDVITAEHLAFRVMAGWAEGRELTAGAASRFWRTEAFAAISRDPGRFARLMATKVRLFFHTYESHDIGSAYVQSIPMSVPLLVSFLALWPAGLVGMALTRKRWRDLLPIHGLFLVVFATTVAFYVNCRLRLPVTLPLALFAGATVESLGQAVTARRTRSVSVITAAAMLLAVFFSWPHPVADDDRYRSRAFFSHFQPGIRFLGAGRTREARDAFVEALRLYPGLAGSVLQAIDGRPYDEALMGVRTMAIEASRKPSLGADAATKRFGEAMAAARLRLYRREYAQAADLFSAAARINPNSYRAYYERSFCLRQMGDSEGALRDLKKAFDTGMKMRSGLDKLYVELASAALMTGDRAGAEMFIRRALFVNPASAPAREIMARLPKPG